MKKIALLFFLASSLLSLHGQKNVLLHFVQKAGSEDFALGNVITSDAGYAYKPTRLQYYVSLPVVIHDGGQMAFPDTRYFLVDAAEDVYLDLGMMNVENVEGVIFSIGVDEARNHLDPANYPPGHPLAPQNPSMHWGWVAGYRFIAMDGNAGPNFVYPFEIHSIGDELYQTLNLETGAEADGDNLVIHLQADYNKLLQDIDVSGGLNAHGNLGPAAKIMENIGSIVFSPLSPSSLSDRSFGGSFSIGPNPAAGAQAQASLYLPSGHAYRLSLSDLTGRTLYSYDLNEGFSTLDIQSPGAGMYLVQLWQNGIPVRTEKWIVTE